VEKCAETIQFGQSIVRPLQIIERDRDQDSGSAFKPESYDEAQLSSDRREARCLVSDTTVGGWVAIRKTILTDVLGAGNDARIVGLTPAAEEVLKLMCRPLIDLRP